MRGTGNRRAADLPEAGHEDRVRLLGEISSGGLTALLHVLHRAHTGEDPAARAMTLSSLLRALPDMGSVTVHELIATEGIREDQRLAGIDPGRVASLVRALSR